MKIPYSIQGMLFMPALVSLMFLLKLTCPTPAGSGCFADTFLPSMFLPVNFLHAFLPRDIVTYHELLLILAYWGVVGLFAGLLVDILISFRKSH